MQSYWRSLLGISLASALAIAPLLVLATAKGKLHPTPIQHYFSLGGVTPQEIGILYLKFAAVCFVFFLCVGAMVLFMSLMIDRVPPPFPHPRQNEKGDD